MKNTFVKVSLAFLSLSPLIVSAQFGTINRYITAIGNMIEKLIPIVMGIALLLFFWGLAKFILKAGDEKEVASGRRLMVWGLITLFVMSMVWGLVRFIGRQLEITPDNAPTVPNIPKLGR